MDIPITGVGDSESQVITMSVIDKVTRKRDASEMLDNTSAQSAISNMSEKRRAIGTKTAAFRFRGSNLNAELEMLWRQKIQKMMLPPAVSLRNSDEFSLESLLSKSLCLVSNETSLDNCRRKFAVSESISLDEKGFSIDISAEFQADAIRKSIYELTAAIFLSPYTGIMGDIIDGQTAYPVVDLHVAISEIEEEVQSSFPLQSLTVIDLPPMEVWTEGTKCELDNTHNLKFQLFKEAVTTKRVPPEDDFRLPEILNPNIIPAHVPTVGQLAKRLEGIELVASDPLAGIETVQKNLEAHFAASMHSLQNKVSPDPQKKDAMMAQFLAHAKAKCLLWEDQLVEFKLPSVIMESMSTEAIVPNLAETVKFLKAEPDHTKDDPIELEVVDMDQLMCTFDETKHGEKSYLLADEQQQLDAVKNSILVDAKKAALTSIEPLVEVPRSENTNFLTTLPNATSEIMQLFKDKVMDLSPVSTTNMKDDQTLRSEIQYSLQPHTQRAEQDVQEMFRSQAYTHLKLKVPKQNKLQHQFPPRLCDLVKEFKLQPEELGIMAERVLEWDPTITFHAAMQDADRMTTFTTHNFGSPSNFDSLKDLLADLFGDQTLKPHFLNCENLVPENLDISVTAVRPTSHSHLKESQRRQQSVRATIPEELQSFMDLQMALKTNISRNYVTSTSSARVEYTNIVLSDQASILWRHLASHAELAWSHLCTAILAIRGKPMPTSFSKQEIDTLYGNIQTDAQERTQLENLVEIKGVQDMIAYGGMQLVLAPLHRWATPLKSLIRKMEEKNLIDTVLNIIHETNSDQTICLILPDNGNVYCAWHSIILEALSSEGVGTIWNGNDSDEDMLTSADLLETTSRLYRFVIIPESKVEVTDFRFDIILSLCSNMLPAKVKAIRLRVVPCPRSASADKIYEETPEEKKDIFTFQCGPKVSRNATFLEALENKQGISVLSASSERMKSVDVILSSKSCVKIVDMKELLASGFVPQISETVTNVSQAYERAYIVLIEDENLTQKREQLMSKLAETSASLARFSMATKPFLLRILVSRNISHAAALIRQVGENEYHTEPKEAQELWLSSSWMDDRLSLHEWFLLQFQCINSFSAQQLLNNFSFRALAMTSVDSMKSLCPGIPAHALHQIFNVLHRKNEPTGNFNNAEDYQSPKQPKSNFNNKHRGDRGTNPRPYASASKPKSSGRPMNQSTTAREFDSLSVSSRLARRPEHTERQNFQPSQIPNSIDSDQWTSSSIRHKTKDFENLSWLSGSGKLQDRRMVAENPDDCKTTFDFHFKATEQFADISPSTPEDFLVGNPSEAPRIKRKEKPRTRISPLDSLSYTLPSNASSGQSTLQFKGKTPNCATALWPIEGKTVSRKSKRR